MAVSPKRGELIEQARSLFGQGMDKKEIAAMLGVSRSTLHRWELADLKLGISWARERDLERKLHPERIQKLLERRFSKMVLEGEGGASADPVKAREGYEARLLKMLQVIRGFRDSSDDVTRMLWAMERFADFCSRTLSREDLAVVRSAVAGFIKRIRSQDQ